MRVPSTNSLAAEDLRDRRLRLVHYLLVRLVRADFQLRPLQVELSRRELRPAERGLPVRRRLLCRVERPERERAPALLLGLLGEVLDLVDHLVRGRVELLERVPVLLRGLDDELGLLLLLWREDVHVLLCVEREVAGLAHHFCVVEWN